MVRTPLSTPGAAFAATRLAAHRLAAYVISPARRRATERIGLRAGEGVYVTPPFGPDATTVALHPDAVVVTAGGTERREPVTSLAGAAAFVLGGPPDLEWARTFDVPEPGDVDAPLALDRAAAALLGAWFRFGFDILTEMAGDAGPAASDVQLWPEHFDAAVDVPHGGGRMTFGASPGDHTSDEPYLYVLPPGPVAPGPLWNAEGFTGAVLRLSEFLDAADQRAAALAFLRGRRDAA